MAASRRSTAPRSSSAIAAIPGFPPPWKPANMLRQIVYGVADAGDVGRNRRRTRARPADPATGGRRRRGADDHGFPLRFQVTARRKLDLPGERVNAPGGAAQRGPNQIGVWEDMPAKPRTLSHVVCFVPDIAAAEAFYVKRLGFKVTDRLLNAGPFLRPAGTQDHHTLFFIQTPPLHEGLRAFRVPYGRADRADAGGHAFRQSRLSIVLGARAAQVRLQLVLVFQQPARLPRRI